LKLLTEILTKDGHRVRPASSGELAMRSVAAKLPELILLDVRLPGIDGFEVCRQLKSQELTRKVPVIFFTDLGDTMSKVKGFELGGLDFISKPYQAQEVLARVRSHLNLYKTEMALEASQEHLEERVRERTEELTQANELLRESELKFRSVTNSAIDAIISADSEGKIVSWNQGATLIFGYKEDEILGHSLTLLIPDRYRKAHSKALQRINETGKTRLSGQVVELSAINKNGTEFPVEISLSSWTIKDRRYFSSVIRNNTERKLREESLRLRDKILLNMGEGVVLVKARDASIVYVNPKIEKMFGYNPGELLGKNISSVNTPTDKSPEDTAQSIINALHNNGTWNGSIQNLRKDGTYFWSKATISAFEHQKHGKVWLSMHEDITERKQMDDALKESEEKIRSMLLSTGEAVFGLDTNGDCTFCNPACLNILGYHDTSELLGNNMHQLIHHSHNDGTELTVQECRISKAFRKGEGTHVDDEVLWRKDGTSFDAEYRSHPIFREKEIVGAVVSFTDISERKKSEQQTQRFLQTQIVINTLLQSATESHSLDKQLETALNLILSEGWIASLNKGAIFLYDKDSEELVMKTHKGMSDQLQNSCARITSGQCLCGLVLETRNLIFADSIDDRYTFRDAESKSHGNYCVPIHSGDQFLGVLNVYLPKGHIRREEEEEFLNTIANTLSGIIERRRLDEELQQAKTLAEQANIAKSAFLATMSHEIRTPMNAILGMGEMLAESNLNDDQRHYVKITNNAGEGLMSLINDVLDLSKIEADQLELETIVFEPDKLANNSVEILKSKALNQGIGIETAFDSALPYQVVGDPQRLQQILLNLLSNAIKFTERGNITLSVIKTGDNSIRFSVADTGIGIQADRLEAIFDPFKQVDSSTTRRFGGTGLGLSICQKLVEKMEGKIWVESQLGQGSTFHAEIPLQEIRRAKVIQSSEGSQTQSLPEVARAGLSILLAEDTEENYLVIEAFLKDTPHQLTIVEDGLQALEKFKAVNFDIVLMDVHMPVMDGYEATREIRAWEGKNNLTPTPVLALTANAMKDDIAKTQKAGCNLHLSKPIRKKRLLEALGIFMPS
ncbi:MAG: PAS domain S-box protein, partial [Magnetococcales bacterium]|nr:PAS domain S-box protein [Magnetococcales bacterium]